MIPSLEELYVQCRIDSADTGEDSLLEMYVEAARLKAEVYLNRRLYDERVADEDASGMVINSLVKLAVMQLVGYWYENREQANVVPEGFYHLIKGYRFIPGT